ncbi:Ig-like domain-containing protein [Gammaproteobacteria bacterium]|nr:Ig-like domain-containing protein [Gammaproteobacteria bacterium]
MKNFSIYILTLSFILASCGGGGGGGGDASPAPVPFSLSIGLTSFATDEDTSYSGSLNATANETVTLTYAITSSPSNGQLTLSSNGSITYNPNADFFGSDEFQYSVTAVEKSVTKNATVSISVNGINDEPTITVTQLTADDNTDYPLFISDSGLLEVSISIDDIDNETSSLTLEASSSQGDITLNYDAAQSTSSATIDLSQIDLAGKIDIVLTVSDGEYSVSDTMKLWYAREIITDNDDFVYELFGNQANATRQINKVIALDSLASDEIIISARAGLKSFVEFIGENNLDYFINRYMNVLVAETPKGDGSVLGVKTDCEGAADPDTYCADNDTIEFINNYLGNYFSDIDDISIITGIDGRGVAYDRLSFQPLIDSDIRSVRGVVLTLKHEFGHTFSILGDEYTSDFENGNVDCLGDDDDENNDYSCGQIDMYPNISSEQTPEELRWKHHIADIDNVNGFDNINATDGIGMYEGAYQGTDDVYRGSYESVMNGGIGTGYIDYRNSGISSKGVQWDEIGQEAFAIQSLKFQGLHGMSTSTDEDGNYIVTQNLNVSENDFHIDWYIDGVLDSSKRNLKSVTLEKKTTGWSTAGIRVSEVNPQFIEVEDDIYTFADAYRGLFSFSSSPIYCSGRVTNRPIYSTIEGYEEPFCRQTLFLGLVGGSSLWYHLDNFDKVKEYTIISYFYETSALGELFGIDWSNQ